MPSEALFGASAVALEQKLDAVRYCAAAANLGTRSSLERVAQWLLRELPEAVVVPCGPAPDDENVRCDTVAYRSAATGVRVRASTAAIMDWLQPASVLWHAAGTDCPTGAALRA